MRIKRGKKRPRRRVTKIHSMHTAAGGVQLEKLTTFKWRICSHRCEISAIAVELNSGTVRASATKHLICYTQTHTHTDFG